MDHFKRSALQRFIHLREKSPPPVFVGRQAVIHDILMIANQTRQEKTGIPGNTTVITGAPGAGKSSVLGEIHHRSSDENHVRVFYASESDVIQNLPMVLQSIAYAGMATPAGWRKALVRFGHHWASHLPTVSGFGMTVDLKRLFTSPPPKNLREIATRYPREMWTSVVILAVDEVQRLPPDQERDHALFLRNIHDAATGLPLTLVLAGLGDTHDRLRSMGLTHGIQPSALGCFSRNELDELTEAWCEHFGIQIGSCRSQIDDLMAPTDGWPRHVHWAQQALAEALLFPGIDGHADRITDWSAVQRRSDTLRYGYYAAQYSRAMVASRTLVGRVMRDVARADRTGNRLTLGQVVDAVDTYNGAQPGSEWTLPDDMTARSYVIHLIHCGALEETPQTGTLSCPIPSFQNYILRRGGIDPTTLEPAVDGNTSSLPTEDDDSSALPEPTPPGLKDDDPTQIP